MKYRPGNYYKRNGYNILQLRFDYIRSFRTKWIVIHDRDITCLFAVLYRVC